MALAVGAAARLHEAVVEGEVVADAVAPAGTAAPEVRIVVQYPLIDVAEYQLALLGAEDRHGDDADVTVVRFRFVVGSDGLLVRSSRGEQIAVSYRHRNNNYLFIQLDYAQAVHGSVVEWLGYRTCDQQVAGSNPGHLAAECNPGQVVYTHVPLSPSSIICISSAAG